MIIGTIQLLQFEIFANIKCCQADTVAIQLFEIFKETDSFKTFDCITGWNRHILDIHIELAIAVFVTAFFEKAPKFLIREIKLKIRRIKINFCACRVCRKALKGKKVNTIASVNKALTRRVRFENRCFMGCSFRFLCCYCCAVKRFQPVCAVEGRMVILPSTTASSISCSRKYSIRIS